jgi:hypothetical protein
MNNIVVQHLLASDVGSLANDFNPGVQTPDCQGVN